MELRVKLVIITKIVQTLFMFIAFITLVTGSGVYYHANASVQGDKRSENQLVHEEMEPFFGDRLPITRWHRYYYCRGQVVVMLLLLVLWKVMGMIVAQLVVLIILFSIECLFGSGSFLKHDVIELVRDNAIEGIEVDSTIFTNIAKRVHRDKINVELTYFFCAGWRTTAAFIFFVMISLILELCSVCSDVPRGEEETVHKALVRKMVQKRLGKKSRNKVASEKSSSDWRTVRPVDSERESEKQKSEKNDNSKNLSVSSKIPSPTRSTIEKWDTRRFERQPIISKEVVTKGKDQSSRGSRHSSDRQEKANLNANNFNYENKARRQSKEDSARLRKVPANSDSSKMKEESKKRSHKNVTNNEPQSDSYGSHSERSPRTSVTVKTVKRASQSRSSKDKSSKSKTKSDNGSRRKESSTITDSDVIEVVPLKRS